MARKKSVVTDVKAVEVTDEVKVFKALASFRDRDGKIVPKGAEYQSDDAEWIEYLAGSKNKTGKPVIG